MLYILSVFLFLFGRSVSAAEPDLTGALSLFRAGRYEEAKEKFLAYPDDPTALYYTGLCETDPAKAEALFDRLAERYPTHDLADDALYEIGELRYAGGDYGTARATFEQIVQMFPEGNLKDRCSYRIGLTWMAEKEPQKARMALERVGERSEVAAEARFATCETYAAEGDTGRAIAYGEALLGRPDIDEIKGRVLALLARCYRAAGREQDAVRAMRRLRVEAGESDAGAVYAEDPAWRRPPPQAEGAVYVKDVAASRVVSPQDRAVAHVETTAAAKTVSPEGSKIPRPKVSKTSPQRPVPPKGATVAPPQPVPRTTSRREKKVQEPQRTELPPPVDTAPAPDMLYAVQVGAFRDPANVEKLVAQYKALGFEVTVVDKVVRGTTLKAVLVGRYRTEQEAVQGISVIYRQSKIRGHTVRLPEGR
jgi:cell division septation protein DedD